MENKRKLYILLDYDNRFYAEWDKKEFNLKKFITSLGARGFEVKIKKFSEIDFSSINFRGSFVLYSSSEAGFYKDYIEDILLGIEKQGGILIPDFYLFRAHHNKVFQEYYKDLFGFRDLGGRPFGSLKEFEENLSEISLPKVLKTPDAFGSAGVSLSKDQKQARRQAKKLSDSIKCFAKRSYYQTRAILAAKLGIRDRERIYRNNTRKFVVQEFIPNLKDDWKILIYGEKYYVLNREVRTGDFRASGSGKFSYVDPPEGMLDYCRDIFNKLKTPYLSLDIAFDGQKYYLIEFQSVYFGLFTILNAKYFYEKEGDIWKKKEYFSTVEEEMALSIFDFLDKYFKDTNK